jgi:hypothetical protein
VAVLRLSGPQILTLSDLAQQGFDPKSFDELLRRLDPRTSNYASGDDDFPTSFLRTLERANRGTLVAPAGRRSASDAANCLILVSRKPRSVSDLTATHPVIVAEPGSDESPTSTGERLESDRS